MSWSSRRSPPQQRRWRRQQEWSRPSHNSRPPLPPDFSSVPSWEKRFCINVCRIPWRRFCEAKEMIGLYRNVMEWDDSAAKEAFDKAKARFLAEINGLHCDISLPDPNLYIDKIDYNAHIDPELVADLEKAPPSLMVDCKDDTNVQDSTRSSVKASRWDSGEAPQGEHTSNWDVHLDRHIIPTGWGDEDPGPTDGTSNKNNSMTALNKKTWETNGGKTWDRSAGWGGGNWRDESCCSPQVDAWINGRDNSWNNPRISSWSDGRDSAWKTGSNSSWRNRDSMKDEADRKFDKKRERGGSFGSRFTKSRYQIHDQQPNNTWKNQGKSRAYYPYEQVA